MEDDRIKHCRVGTAYLVKPTPDNFVVRLLAHYGIPPDRILGYVYKGEEFLDFDADKYGDYKVAFFGVSPDEGLPTRFIFGRDNEKTLDVWHIMIYWRDVDDACIEASWSEAQCDFIAKMRLGRLDTLNPRAAKFLADGLTLLLWMQERMTKEMRGGRNNVKVADLEEDIRKALGKRYVELRDNLKNIRRDAKSLISVVDDWRASILRKYEIFNNYPDLLEKIDPYSVPGDDNASEGVIAPWEIAIEIAAREAIPGYVNNSVSSDTLRKILILPNNTEE